MIAINKHMLVSGIINIRLSPSLHYLYVNSPLLQNNANKLNGHAYYCHIYIFFSTYKDIFSQGHMLILNQQQPTQSCYKKTSPL